MRLQLSVWLHIFPLHETHDSYLLTATYDLTVLLERCLNQSLLSLKRLFALKGATSSKMTSCKVMWCTIRTSCLEVCMPFQIKYSFRPYEISADKLAARRQESANPKWRPPPLRVINVSFTKCLTTSEQVCDSLDVKAYESFSWLFFFFV